MKKIYISLFAISILFFSCKKEWLEMKQPGVDLTSDEYFSDPSTAFELVVATYDQLNGTFGKEWTENNVFEWVVGSVFSDDAMKGGESAADQQDFLDGSNFNLTGDNGISYELWEQLYRSIYRANVAIDKIGNFTDDELSAAIKNEYIAEMRFVKCFAYFRLIRVFGDVPLFKDVNDYATITNTPRGEVYAHIEEELLLAIPDLPDTRFGGSDQGRAIKGAAQGYLAMTYLYQEKWADAKAMCENIMNSGTYSLVADPKTIFTTAEQWGTEVLWASNADDLTGANSGWEEGSYLSVWYSPRNDQQGHQGWGFHLPTQNLVDAFEAGDSRRDAWIVDDGESIEGVGIPYALPGPEFQATGYMCEKYVLPSSEFNTTAPNAQAIDQIHMRYADVLLMHAEASMELGLDGEAKSSLALVRERAGLSAYPDAATIAGYKESSLLGHSELRAVVYHERRIELALENSRFFDLVRWGDAQPVLNDFGVTTFVQGCSELLPIPTTEIDRAEGLLDQNPCY